MRACACVYACVLISSSDGRQKMLSIKLFAFELAAKFSRRRENPVQPRLCNAKNAIFKRFKTGFSLRSRSSLANSNAISFTALMVERTITGLESHVRVCVCVCVNKL